MKKVLTIIIFLCVLTCMSKTMLNAQWIQTSGPSDVWVSALAANGTTLFAGTAHPGLNEGNVFLLTMVLTGVHRLVVSHINKSSPLPS
jgi:hypothetical protein